MSKPIKVLIVEDLEDDVLLIVEELKKGGYDPKFEQVQTREEMKKALSEKAWDIVLSDYKMPHFGAPEALRILKDTDFDIPFIVVSGTIGEDVAVGLMKQGAHDYVMKGNLLRLCVNVEHEMRDAEHRRQRKKAEEKLSASEKRYRMLFEQSKDAIFVVDPETKMLVDCNKKAEKLIGRAREEILSMCADRLHPEDVVEETMALLRRQAAGEDVSVTTQILTKDGKRIPVSISMAIMDIGGKRSLVGAFRDITERKKLEDEKEQLLRDVTESMKELDLLYSLSDLAGKNDITWGGAFQEMLCRIPRAYQYPEIVCVKITVGDDEFKTDNFKTSTWVQSADINVSGKKVGTVEVYYLEERPECYEGPFLKEERKAINTLGEQFGRIIMHKGAQERLQKIEWLLNKSIKPKSIKERGYEQEYGSVVDLNTNRLILDSVGEDALFDIADEFLGLLDTCAAFYEKNGDYAYGNFTSDWCRFLDQTSRKLCGAVTNKEALASGKWVCHESCWGEASRVSIETAQPTDIECKGGIRIYTVPIFVDKEVVGSINFGYGDPPRDPEKIQELAVRYNVSPEKLLELANSYEKRPDYMIEFAKSRLSVAAKRIGNIIERKKREEEIEKAKAYLDTIIDMSPFPMWICDREGMMVRSNRALRNVLNVTDEELIGKYNVFNDDNVTKHNLMTQVKDVFYKQKSTSFEFQWKGSYVRDVVYEEANDVYLAASMFPIVDKRGELINVICQWIDITERKNLEKELRVNEERYRRVFEGVKDSIFVADAQTWELVDCNKSAEKLVGRTRDEIISMRADQLYPEDEVDAIMEIFKRQVAGEEVFGESFVLSKDGRRIPVVISTSFIEMTGKKYLMGVFRDITESQGMEKKIVSLSKFPSENPNPVMRITEDGTILYSNEKGLELLTEWNTKIRGKVPEKWCRLIKKKLESVKTSQKEEEEEEEEEASGRIFSVVMALVKEAGYVNFYFRDVTERKKLQKDLEDKLVELKEMQSMLVQSEKLASLGRLVSDMAHEVNNPLMVISGRAQLTLMDYQDNPSDVEENMKIVVDQCQRAKEIIQRLLLFSKPSRGERKETDINGNVHLVVELIGHQYLLEDITIEEKYDTSISRIRIDEKQMHEVFMNLIKNSAEAMPDGGKITVTTSQDEDDVFVTVADNGEGISKEAMSKIFDPFFTTKEQGTGLGVSVCYGILKSHGGELRYSSDPGKGTTAVVTLPFEWEEGESAELDKT
ncbi:MAG: PAS domain S-box protein [Candidatus Tantalella remota]|nr:PAS domain S-box protein [Candidatus Tantalella remota]